jgi:hypothetical protein
MSNVTFCDLSMHKNERNLSGVYTDKLSKTSLIGSLSVLEAVVRICLEDKLSNTSLIRLLLHKLSATVTGSRKANRSNRYVWRRKTEKLKCNNRNTTNYISTAEWTRATPSSLELRAADTPKWTKGIMLMVQNFRS